MLNVEYVLDFLFQCNKDTLENISWFGERRFQLSRSIQSLDGSIFSTSLD